MARFRGLLFRRLLPGALLLSWILFLFPRSARAERPRVYAISEATVVVSPGRLIESGRIVIRDGLIEAVGADVPIPPDATEIDGKGHWVYAGLIDAYSSLGLKEEAPSAGAPTAGEGMAPAGPRRQQAGQPPGAVHPISRVRAERRVRDQLLTFEEDRKRQM